MWRRLFLLAALLLPPLLAEASIVVVGLMSDRAIVKINGTQHLIKVGESVDDVTLLSVNSREAVLRVGKTEQRFGLGMSTGLSEREQQTVDISMNRYGQYIATGQINGRVVEFLVDTGANTVSMTTEDARQLGIDFRRFGQPSQSVTAGGVVRSWQVMLDSVKVGAIVVRNVDASVRDTPRNGPVLLGMTFLSRVTLTHEQNRLRLTSR